MNVLRQLREVAAPPRAAGEVQFARWIPICQGLGRGEKH